MRHAALQPFSALAGAGLVGLTLLLAGMLPAQDRLTDEQARVLEHMSIQLVPDGQGGFNPTLVISGVNVQVVNGLGATATTNGLGNLIVGYDELGLPADHTGSHNFVGGSQNRYASYGGLVLGFDNWIDGPYAAVSGGQGNLARGDSASVSGGAVGFALGRAASVSGGKANTAYGDWSSISGGWVGSATGELASVSGGLFNFADGDRSTISGGEYNEADGAGSTVSGGCDQLATADCAHVP